jgi:hypothetical protein
MVSAPHVASNTFHSTSSFYSRVEESSANTPTPSTNRYDFNKGSDTKLTIEDLPVEYRQELEVQQWKMEEVFMAHYDLTSQELVLRDIELFVFEISKVIPEVENTTK